MSDHPSAEYWGTGITDKTPSRYPMSDPQALEDARIENAMDAAFGLRDKYHVERVGGTPHKHDDCDYFVLDWKHDPFTIPAALSYADACEKKYPQLARDLRARAALAREETPRD